MTDQDRSQLLSFRKKRDMLNRKITDFTALIESLRNEILSREQEIHLNTRLADFTSVLNSFNSIQNQIFDISMSDETDIEYGSNFESAYYTAISEARLLLEVISTSLNEHQDNHDEPSDNVSEISKQSQNNNNIHARPSRHAQVRHIQLPTISLPKFDGHYSKWLEFHDTFVSLIHENESLSDIQRLHYLKASLCGDAAEIINGLQVSAINYSIAWNLLCERYTNTKLLVQNHLRELFSISECTKESASQLREMLDTTSRQLRSLEALGQPVMHWDTIVIYLLSSKFDKVTARDWELFKSTSDIPTLDELKRFLSNKANMLDNLILRDMKTQKPIQRTHKAFVSSNLSCYYCKDHHAIYNCPKFLSLAVNDRMSTVKNLKLCINCLKSSHVVDKCNLHPNGCKICKQKHNTLLHKGTTNNSTVSPEVASNSASNSVVAQLSMSAQSHSNSCQVLLATALILIEDVHGKLQECRILLDSGSQSCFISQSCCLKLGLPAKDSRISIQGINQSVSHIRQECIVMFHSKINSFHAQIKCLIIDKICEQVPGFYVTPHSLIIPDSVPLADPQFDSPNSVDLLIGAEIFWSIMLPGQIKLGKNLPILQNTNLGWIISGPIKVRSGQPSHCLFTSTCSIQDQLQRFWELEECPKTKPLSREQELCESKFVETIHRDQSGRFVVSIPLKNPPSILGDSKVSAERRLIAVEKRLQKNSQLNEAYIQFMEEYEALGHMSEVEANSNHGQIQNFLPHHVVVNQSSKTTKYRVVFDGSSVTTTGVSFNDLQLVGPMVQNDLFIILIRFRQYAFAFSADIKKMYRQILIRPEDRCLQRILWRSDSSQPIKIFELNTVTYGTASAPFLATRCLVEIAKIASNQYPNACLRIKEDMYVDDLLSGGDSIEEVESLCKQVNLVLKSCHFELHKWESNVPQVLPIPVDVIQNEKIEIGSNETTKTLGLYWTPTGDTLNYKIKEITVDGPITKRSILSEIGKVFDPLGLLSACTIVSKIILQQLWNEQLGWDDELPNHLTAKWHNFRTQLCQLNDLQISRHVLCLNPVQIELHCFSDASELAYSCCIYIRSIDNDGNIHSNLLCAKSKVAPLKKTTIPRLELCGAHLSAKLMNSVRESLRLTINQIYMWCDSTIVLSWLNTSPHQLKVFVSHRVADIQDKCTDTQWCHVSTKDNPADLNSRGISPAQLQSSSIWWNGPSWLSGPHSEWPKNSPLITPEMLPEIKRVENVFTSFQLTLSIDFTRFSNFNRLLRTIAFVRRFISNCKTLMKKQGESLTGSLSIGELNAALIILVKTIQGETWSNEIKCLTNDTPISSKSKIVCLNPFIDKEGVIRVGGRLQASELEFPQKHQILLPKHYVTTLLLRWEHIRLHHAGPQLLLTSIRETYWPLSARTTIRLIVHYCVRCFRCRPRNLHPLMGNLPSPRIRPSMPFQVTGVDYAGPLLIKDRPGRNYKQIKCYIAVFVCLAVKSIHIELVSNLSTEAFMAAFKRFISRRGKPTKIYSDNGSNFVGAKKELSELFKFVLTNEQEFSERLSVEGITWSFIPPNSPNFGGLWEAAVKSLKFHLKRIVGNALLTFEQLNTLLTQIECILNSRPLTQLSCDPNDLEPLTPSHFLIGRPLTSLPESSLVQLPINRLSEYQRIQQMRQHFWTRWSREYLQSLQPRTKWKHDHPSSLRVGTMVLLGDNAAPPLQWAVGRIVELFPGADNIIRVVSVRTAKGTFKRAATKVYPLPVNP